MRVEVLFPTVLKSFIYRFKLQSNLGIHDLRHVANEFR